MDTKWYHTFLTVPMQILNLIMNFFLCKQKAWFSNYLQISKYVFNFILLKRIKDSKISSIIIMSHK